MSGRGHAQSYFRRAGFLSFNLEYLLSFCFTVSSTKGLTATHAGAFELFQPIKQELKI